jgi:O-succinylhomoserine sulfhydrylase
VHAQNAGMVLSPFNAWVVLKGLETLNIRMRRKAPPGAGTGAVAGAAPGSVARVLPRPASHPQHALAMRQMSGLGGAVLSFDVRAADAAGARTRIPRARQHCRCCRWPPTWATPRPCMPHPASTSHGKLTEAQRQAAGIGQGLIRLAVGLEHLDDIKADLLRGLDTLNPS